MNDNKEKDKNTKTDKSKGEPEVQLLWFLFNIALNIVDPFKIIRNYFLKPTFALGIYSVEKFKEKTEEQWVNTQNLVIRMFGALVAGLVIICAAILMYAIFYFSYMPAITYVRPLHMQYKRICEDQLENYELCQKRQVDDKASAYHSYPDGHLELSKKHMLMVGQPYIISITLDLPDSPKNHEVGMFMVCAELKAQSNNYRQEQTLKASSCRSTMLQYYSPLMHKLKSLIYFPFIVTGLYEQKQYLSIEMFPSYVDDATNPVTDIYVEIQSKVIEFYSSTIEITAHFTGLRYIMYNYPVLSATFGICGNLMFILLLLILCWYHWDNDMEWIEEARTIYKNSQKEFNDKEGGSPRFADFKDPKNLLNENVGESSKQIHKNALKTILSKLKISKSSLQDSSSITTEKSNLDDENLSILDMNESDSNSIDDAEFYLDKDDLDKNEEDLMLPRKDDKKLLEE